MKRIERVLFYDLSGRIIKHLSEWKVYYKSGTIRTVKGYGFDNLNKKQFDFYVKSKLQQIHSGFYGESATTKTFVYY